MSTIQITITKSTVYDAIEGITATIGKKNPDVSFENLWANTGDSNSLDLFWDEATLDIENTLQHWLVTKSTTKDPYTLQLNVADDWPTALTASLANAASEYMIHAIIAAWLGITPGLQIGIDYTQVAADDLGNIVGMILKRRPIATADKRHTDTIDQPDESASITADKRHTDTIDQPDESASITADERHADDKTQQDEAASITAGSRHTDTADQPDESASITAGARHTDDSTYNEDSIITAGARHNNRDHVAVHIEHETLNMSGVYYKKY